MQGLTDHRFRLRSVAHLAELRPKLELGLRRNAVGRARRYDAVGIADIGAVAVTLAQIVMKRVMIFVVCTVSACELPFGVPSRACCRPRLSVLNRARRMCRAQCECVQYRAPPIEDEVRQLFARHGFAASDIPRGIVTAENVDPIRVTLRWQRVQAELEQVICSRLCLQSRPQLPLLIKWVNKPDEPQQLRFVFVDPASPIVKKLLISVLQITKEDELLMFRPTGEVLP